MRVGLVSGDGGAWFLPRVVGLSRAYEMTFTGNFIKADQALAWGLASQVVPKAELMDTAGSWPSRLLSHPPHSLRMCKKLVRDSGAIGLPSHLEMAASMQALVQHTADQHEAVKAFLEKRKPQFKGASDRLRTQTMRIVSRSLKTGGDPMRAFQFESLTLPPKAEMMRRKVRAFLDDERATGVTRRTGRPGRRSIPSSAAARPPPASSA